MASFDEILDQTLGVRGEPPPIGPESIANLSGAERRAAAADLTSAITGYRSRPRDTAGRREWDRARRNVRLWVEGRGPRGPSVDRLQRATSKRPNASTQRAMRQGARVNITGRIRVSRDVRSRTTSFFWMPPIGCGTL